MMHVEYVYGDWLYKLYPFKKGTEDYLGISRYCIQNTNDWTGWSGPYADAPISDEMRAYLDRALKLKAFW
jgi:hypothetical protein